MSRVATLPCNSAALASAPLSRLSCWTEVGRNRRSLATTEPAVPFGMSRSATSAGCSSVPAWTSFLYCETNARSSIPASAAETAAMMIAPRRVPANRRAPSSGDVRLRVASMVMSLSRHDGDAAADGCQVTRRFAGSADVHRVHVLDEVADDQARVVPGHGIVAVALAGVGEAGALTGPPGDVEVGEVRDGEAVVARAA